MHDSVDDLSLRFDNTYMAWRHRRSQHKRSADLLGMLLRDYRRVWETGDDHTRQVILSFLSDIRAPGGEDIVWASLHSNRRRLVGPGLGAALVYVLGSHVQPDARAVLDLMRIATSTPLYSTRVVALHILARGNVEGLESWLHELADGDPSPSIRREANIALMRKGDAAAKAALFHDLRAHPEYAGVAHDLWEHRHAAGLTEDEEQDLRDVILGAMESIRRWLRSPDRGSVWFEMLGLYARDGFPFGGEGIELL